MKLALLIIGTLLLLFGLVVMGGTLVQMVDGAAKNSILGQVILIVTVGIVPISVGTVFINKALKSDTVVVKK